MEMTELKRILWDKSIPEETRIGILEKELESSRKKIDAIMDDYEEHHRHLINKIR